MIHHLRFTTDSRHILGVLWGLAAIAIAVALGAGDVFAAEHSPALDQVIANSPPEQTIPVVLFLASRLQMDDVYPVAQSLPMNERRDYVVQALKSRFDEMGSRVMTRLEAARKDRQVTLLRPLWILNAVRVHVVADVLDDLDKYFPEVVYITHDARYENTLDYVAWGVADIGAVTVWQRWGVDGSGVIVGHKDSGLDWDLPAFIGHVWLNDGEDLNHNGVIDTGETNGTDDDRNGYIDDFYGWNFEDDNNDVSDQDGHGTSSGSIITSNFTPCDTVCVAPGAKLMELVTYNTQGACFEASQYAIEMGAQVISASISFKQSECDDNRYFDCPNYVAHRMVSEMELAAGIVHANSTGNVGLGNPVPLSVPAPANSPPPALTPQHPIQGGVSSMVAVGGYLSDGSHYGGSGRGPSGWSRQDICGHSRMAFCGPEGAGNEYPPEYEDYPWRNGTQRGLLKPDISAPTVVRACARGGGCTTFSGTSAATPHVGGALALIYSAFPGITPESVYLLLMNGALDAGMAGADTLWGFGKLRVVPPCSTGFAQLANVNGVVRNAGGQAIENVRVTSAGARPVLTDLNGVYSLWLAAGQHALRYEKFGYIAVTSNFNLSPGQVVVHDVTLSAAAPATLIGTVIGWGQPQLGIPVSIPVIPWETITDGNGQFTVNLYEGQVDIHYGVLPWEEEVTRVTLPAGPVELELVMDRSPRAMYATGPDAHGYWIYDDYDLPLAYYDWVEINPNAGGLPGETISLPRDTCVYHALPFSFRYYGLDYTGFSICQNGFVIMGNQSTSVWAAFPIPSSAAPNNYIAPFFDDWEPPQGGRVLYYYQADSHRVIVEWYNVPDFEATGRATFELMLYDPAHWPTRTGDGVIKFQYAMFHGRFEGAIGFENTSGTDGVEYLFQFQYDHHAAPIEAGRALLVMTDTLLAADDVHAELPTDFVFEQNFPNPFNPATTFSWTLARAADVKLTLYDVLGREAAIVFNGRCEAGRYQHLFDASGLASGVYFARLDLGSEPAALRKLVLLK